jgi:predicted transcriptional regulator of viral defense system
MKNNNLLELMRSKKTIFTINDLALIWNITNVDFIRKKIYRYIKTGKMYSIRRGIYSKEKNYDKFELANRIYTPSYISFETVLAKAGIIFQYYSQIFIASYLSRELTIDVQIYEFRKLKNSILTNSIGIEVKDNYYIASPERAFLDVIYLNKEYYFDNLVNINWDKVLEILPIYDGNKRMESKVKKYKKEFLKGNK